MLKNLRCEKIGLFLLIIYPIFNSIFVNYLPSINTFFVILEILALVLLLILCFFRNKKNIICISIIYLFVILFELIVRQNTNLIYLFKDIVISSYLIIVFGCSYNEVKQLEIDLYKISLLSLYILALSVLINIQFYMDITGNWLGYQTLFPYCMVLYWCFHYKKIDLKNIIALILGCPLLFLGGTRTPLLLSILLFIICFGRYLYKQRKIFFMIFVAIGTTMGVLFFPIMKLIDNFFLSKGILIRSVHLFGDLSIGALFNFSNRFSLFYLPTIERLCTVPFFGYGIGGDRMILCENINNAECTFQMAKGYYAHNIFLEILQQFGFAFGIIILLVIITILIYMIKKKKLVIPYVFTVFIPLLLSSSWITYTPFWIFISYFLVTIKNDDNFKYNIQKVIERGKKND